MSSLAPAQSSFKLARGLHKWVCTLIHIKKKPINLIKTLQPFNSYRPIMHIKLIFILTKNPILHHRIIKRFRKI